MRTYVDTPEAYEVNFHVGQPPHIENLDELREYSEQSFLTPDEQFTIMDREQRLFGLNAYADPAAYFQKRNEYFAQAKERMTSLIEEFKPVLISSLATYFSRGDSQTHHDLEELFAYRLATVQTVEIGDPLIMDPNATFYDDIGCVCVNAKSIQQVDLGEKPEKDYLVLGIIAHELIHGLLTRAKTVDALLADEYTHDFVSRNGLFTLSVPDDMPVHDYGDLLPHLDWANEAFIEDVRQNIFQTDSGAYPMKTAVLRTLQVLDPMLQASLEAVALGSTPPSQLTGHLELLLGPLGSEKIESIIARQEAPWEKPDVAESMMTEITALLSSDLQAQGKAELSYQWDITKQHLLV